MGWEVVEIDIAGAGCSESLVAPASVTAGSVTIRYYQNVKSPDFDGVGGNGCVNLPDLVEFADEFLLVTAGTCHDYDNSGGTGIGDLIIFSECFQTPIQCVGAGGACWGTSCP